MEVISLSISQKYYRKRKQEGRCPSCSALLVDEKYLTCTKCRTRTSLRYQYKKDEIKDSVRRRAYRIKKDLFSKYGGECIQCKENRLGCLELDHINGGGSSHRAALNLSKIKGGVDFYNKILKEPILPNFLQILCANCHALKHCKYMEFESNV